MRVYVYQGALLCAACGERERARRLPHMIESAFNLGVTFDPADESSYDSDDYPKGPYENGGGEADAPQHCDHCGTFLENPLTPDGVAYVRGAIADYIRSGGMDHGNRTGNHQAAYGWQQFYGPVLLQTT